MKLRYILYFTCAIALTIFKLNTSRYHKTPEEEKRDNRPLETIILKTHSPPPSPPPHRARTVPPPTTTPSIATNNNFFILRVFGFLGDKTLPNDLKRSVGAWPHFDMFQPLWIHDNDTLNSLRLYAPWFIPTYNTLLPIQKSDIARYVALYVHGGVYMDADCTPSTSTLESLWKKYDIGDHGILVFEETILTPAQAQEVADIEPIRQGVPEHTQRIANYFIVAFGKKHKYFLDLLRESATRVQRSKKSGGGDSDYNVLYTTGPDVVTDVTHRWIDAQNVNYPGHHMVGRSIRIIQRPEDQLYFRHAARGSWRKTRLM
eukprot:PhF_6_TR31709/c0_g1_i3/m.46664